MRTATQTQQPVVVEGQRELKVIYSNSQPKKDKQPVEGGYLGYWLNKLTATPHLSQEERNKRDQATLDYLHTSGIIAQHRLSLATSDPSISPV